MAAIERTIYPRFDRLHLRTELRVGFILSDDETRFVQKGAREQGHRLVLAVLLKSFQRLGYFPPFEDVPLQIVRHVRSQLAFRAQVRPAQIQPNTLTRYERQIRAYLQARPYAEGGADAATQVVTEAAGHMDNPADLINAAIEQLRRRRIELPAYSTLEALVQRIRTEVNTQLFEQINAQLSPEERADLDGLLDARTPDGKSALQRLKRLPKRGSLTHFHELLSHVEYLDTLVASQPHLDAVPDIKRRHFAAEARALDASELRDVSPPKRHAILLCLIHRARVQARDDTVETFIKRMLAIRNRAREALATLRQELQEKADTVIATMSDVVRVLRTQPVDAEAGREIRALVFSRETVATLQQDLEALMACRGDNLLPLIWPIFKSHRPVLFRMLRILDLAATSEDDAVMLGLGLAQLHEKSRGDWIEGEADLSFTSKAWAEQIRAAGPDGAERLHRRYFEIAVFFALAEEMRSGDVAVDGSESYGDYRAQLLPWELCEGMLEAYCTELDLPTTAEAFVSALKARLAAQADLVDTGYPENPTLVIDETGMPRLKRAVAREMPKRVRELEIAILERMREVNLVDIVADVSHWTGFTHRFGPLSGSDPKLESPQQRYVLTAFTYGTNLGPAQAARHMRGAVTAHMLGYVNKRHVDIAKLAAACRDVINPYAKMDLPRCWGTGEAAAADGTKYELYDQNLTASYHIRYGGIGGIAYHHVSDTYIALFSHFIPCGLWEAVYIVDGLLKNDSDLQPKRVHADTQGQSLPVFGLAHLLGFELMPRIRNWQGLTFYRAESRKRFDHIDGLFDRVIDWDLLERHWKDLMQVVLSIRAGTVMASTLMRRLGNNSRKNRLYQSFRELGNVLRTIFLLRFISEPELREEISAETNKVESYNGFAKYLYFGGEGVIGENDPNEQEKAIKYNDLVANSVIFWNTAEQTRILRQLRRDGWKFDRNDLGFLSPYTTAHIKRFGDYIIDAKRVPDRYVGELELGPASEPAPARTTGGG